MTKDVPSRIKIVCPGHESGTSQSQASRALQQILLVRSDGMLRSLRKQSAEMLLFHVVCVHNAVVRARNAHSEARMVSVEVWQASTPADVFRWCMHGLVQHWQRMCPAVVGDVVELTMH